MILPPTPMLLLAGALAAFLAGSAAGWSARAVIADRAVAELQASIAQERQRHADAARAAEAKARLTEQARAASIERIERETFTRTQALAADAAAARRAADSLRQHVARLAGRGAAADDPGPAGLGTPAAETSNLLAVVLAESVERNLILAATADAAHSAGLACVKSYEALRAP